MIDKKLTEHILKYSSDPLGVRESTSWVVKNMKFVEVDLKKIKDISKVIKEKVDKKQLLDEEQFGSLDPTPQLIFVLDTVNFCFWAGKDEEKWTVEFPKGNFVSNGWFALVSAIERAQKEGRPILDAKYLEKLTLEETEDIFRSSNDAKIPLLKKRMEFLKEAGKILNKKYDGNIYNLLAKTGLDVGEIAKQIVIDFPMFKDKSDLSGREICFYKRAQIFAYDIALLEVLEAKNLEALTAFADYKIPQILRAFGVLKYENPLAEKIGNYEILKADSREEVEIRSATIWTCEIIAKEAGILPVLVDNALWKMSQSLRDVEPYHRVLTTSY